MRHQVAGSVLVQKLCHVEDDEHMSALDLFHEKDERENRCVGEILEWYRGEDARYLERSELDELVENWTCLNDPWRIFFKSNLEILMEEKSWKTWKGNEKIVIDKKMVHNVVMDEELVQMILMDEELIQKIVMDEELIQNGVMDEKFVKNFVMGAKIDPKVVMDLFIFKKMVDGTFCNPVIE